MNYRICFLLALLLSFSLTVDAQLFKKSKKKKKKHQVEVVAPLQEVNRDSLQLPMADIAICQDNWLNRNAFLGIPLGITGKGFHQRLVAKGFAEPAHQQNYYYLYQGQCRGKDVRVNLMKSDSTGMVYAVSVEEVQVGLTEAEARLRFQELKKQLRQEYGPGYVANSGEEYVVNSPLGSVTLHYERMTGGAGYSVGYFIDDAKAYAQAYKEMEDKTGEELPRKLDANGLADTIRHSDMAELTHALLVAATPQKAKALLAAYDYQLERETAVLLPAVFKMGDYYQARASVTKRGKTVTAVSIVANDTEELVTADLQRMGYTGEGPTYSNGAFKSTLSRNAKGLLVLTISKIPPLKGKKGKR
ncbi:MAG: hypothetical protein IJS97_03545 [Prevotella sp.]|nr:hypothetical protein [Prevotella sp.]